ncbi:MAG: ATP-binding protein, partial [Chloroflexota bacterium]
PAIILAKRHMAQFDDESIGAFRSNKSLIFPNLDKPEYSLLINQPYRALGCRSVSFIPLLENDLLIGVLIIGLAQPGTLTEDQLAITKQLAVELSIAIRQTELRETLQSYTNNLEKLVSERTAQLKSKADELEAFTYSVSHDLRSPLRAIAGFSRTLLTTYKENLPEKGQHYLDRVQKNAIHMGMMIDDLLDLSKVGRTELKIQQINLNHLINEILDDLEVNQQKGNATFVIDPLDDCYGDRNLLRLALSNLINNSIKYSHKKADPRIEIGNFRAQNGSTVYTIQDNGVGFDMKYADKLFGVFQRLHSSREYEGNGIGLATVYRIIEKHGGRVWAHAEPDKGATFYFSL